MDAKRLIVLLVLLLGACGAPAAQDSVPPAASVTSDITPRELASRLQDDDRPFLLDVREPFEVEIASIPGTSALIPLGELEARLDELDRDQEIVVYCRSGNRSQQATRLLQAAGFTRARNLTGGVLRWSADVDPSMPTY